MLESIEIKVGAFSIFCNFNLCLDVLCVYAPVQNGKRGFWVELSDTRRLWNDPRCVEGDLNVVR